MERQLKRLQIRNDEEKKQEHLLKVEAALTKRKLDWYFPMTAFFTAAVILFLVLAPSLGQELKVPADSAASAGYEKGYVLMGDRETMPKTTLTWGVKRFSDTELAEVEALIAAAHPIDGGPRHDWASYELGLYKGRTETYVRVYGDYNDIYYHFTSEDKWYIAENQLDVLYNLVSPLYDNKPALKWIILIGVLYFIYALYIEKKYLKDEEGRRRKLNVKWWYQPLMMVTFFAGMMHSFFAANPFLPLSLVISLCGVLIVACNDFSKLGFEYRKYYYSTLILMIIFYLSVKFLSTPY